MIAKEAGVARKTVETIKSFPELRKRRKPCMILKKLDTPRKCPTCGGMVMIVPCLLCHPESGYYDEYPTRRM